MVSTYRSAYLFHIGMPWCCAIGIDCTNCYTVEVFIVPYTIYTVILNTKMRFNNVKEHLN